MVATRGRRQEDAMVDEDIDDYESEIRVINPIDGSSLFSESVEPGRVLCLKGSYFYKKLFLLFLFVLILYFILKTYSYIELKLNGQIFILVGTGYDLVNNVFTKGTLYLFSVNKVSFSLYKLSIEQEY